MRRQNAAIGRDEIMNWKPIETAPKDQDLLLWWDDEIIPGYLYCGISEGDIGFVKNIDVHLMGQPTHWMPRPEPPQCRTVPRPPLRIGIDGAVIDQL